MTKASDNRSDRREQILAAALELFTAEGMANVSTRQIAQKVGISQPSLYAHFASANAIASDIAGRHGEIGHAHDHGRALAVFGDTQAIVDRAIAARCIKPRGSAHLGSLHTGERLDGFR